MRSRDPSDERFEHAGADSGGETGIDVERLASEDRAVVGGKEVDQGSCVFGLRDHPERGSLPDDRRLLVTVLLGGFLQTIADAGSVEWKAPLPVVARMLVSFFDGLALGWVVDRNSDEARAALDGFIEGLALMARPRSEASPRPGRGKSARPGAAPHMAAT